MCHHSTSFQLSGRIIMTTRYQVQLTQDDDIKSAYELLLWDHSHIYFQDYSIAGYPGNQYFHVLYDANVKHFKHLYELLCGYQYHHT